MSNKRLHRCCFTGHRPEKLNASEAEIKRQLEYAIRAAIKEGFVTFISGMARGADIWAAEIVLQLKKEYIDIKLICACPFKFCESRWADGWKRRYQYVLQNADLVRYISPYYTSDCFYLRNQWMVDRAARVIAVYNGGSGGTRYTVHYAVGSGVKVVN